MSITKDLFLSILAMDSYNRGYGAGIADGKNLDGNGEDIDGLGEAGSGIGFASVKAVNLPSGSQAAGFYAIAYDTPDETVISYRGTDNGPDYLRGWVMGAGLETAWTQADEARSFYSVVTGKDYWEGPAEKTIVTGHSLGGGLAGLVSVTSLGKFPPV